MMNEELAPEEDCLRLNTQRSALILWIVERFQLMLAEGRECDAPVSYTHLTLPTIYSV